MSDNIDKFYYALDYRDLGSDALSGFFGTLEIASYYAPECLHEFKHMEDCIKAFRADGERLKALIWGIYKASNGKGDHYIIDALKDLEAASPPRNTEESYYGAHW